jgi:glutamyl-tRNA synthetase
VFADGFADSYQHLDDPTEWLNQIRETSSKHGFAREASQLVCIALTGATRSPDMHAIAHVIGQDDVLRRLRALLH